MARASAGRRQRGIDRHATVMRRGPSCDAGRKTPIGKIRIIE
jgi:hypothetical protein